MSNEILTEIQALQASFAGVLSMQKLLTLRIQHTNEVINQCMVEQIDLLRRVALLESSVPSADKSSPLNVPIKVKKPFTTVKDALTRPKDKK